MRQQHLTKISRMRPPTHHYSREGRLIKVRYVKTMVIKAINFFVINDKLIIVSSQEGKYRITPTSCVAQSGLAQPTRDRCWGSPSNGRAREEAHRQPLDQLSQSFLPHQTVVRSVSNDLHKLCVSSLSASGLVRDTLSSLSVRSCARLLLVYLVY